ncbi:class I SAM-dependent methyltransferase [Nocardioides marmoraquaticus]
MSGVLSRLPGLGGWEQDPLWASVYDWTVEHPDLGGRLWRLGTGSDLSLLHRAADPVGSLPAGAAVLDVPVGGGVALRALRPGQGVRYVACDLAPTMLRRTRRRARELGVDDQVETVAADVGDLPFADDEFDLVVTLTGLHCFPDPGLAVREVTRVLRPGGSLTGSTILEDSGLRTLAMRRVGRASGILGPGVTSRELAGWFRACGVELDVRRSGPFAYFTGTKAGAS